MRRRFDRAVPLVQVLLLACTISAGPGYAQVAGEALKVVADSATVAGGFVDSTTTVPQRDVGDILASILKRERSPEPVIDDRRGLSKTVLPSLGYNPSYGAYAGVSIALGGWFGDRATTQLSAGSLSGTYSTTGQLSLQFKSDFYLPDNRWVLKGDWRYLDTSQSTWGLGPARSGQSEYPMDFDLYRLFQTAYRRVHDSDFYLGFGYHFDRFADIVDERAGAGESTPFTVYSKGAPSHTTSSGVSVNLLADTRDNPINAQRGLFWNASMRFFPTALGSDHDHQTIYSDFRIFTRLPRRSGDVLAVWNTMWFTFGEVPYLDLPAVGWDTYGRSGRGYLQGRLRGPNQSYTEFEYRKRLSENGLWGGVAFLNLTTTTATNGGSFGPPDYGGGLGLRVKFNKRTSTNLAIDGAYGQDSALRFFFGMQEAF